MAYRQWWQRPHLRADEEEERRVSWLELFFDLIFVVVVSQLAHYLAEHITWAGVFAYIILFMPTWWAWIGGTFYNDRFETYDVSYRVFVLLNMLPIAAMAVFVHDGTGKLAEEFALAYVAARILLIILWLRGSYHNPIFRPVGYRYAAGFTVSVLLFVTSVFVAPPWRFLLWGVGILFDFLTPLTTLSYQARLPRSKFSKLPERFGLFVIIVLGEAIVGVVGGMADRDPLTLDAFVTGALGMILVFGLWWIYFDFVGRRNGPRRSLWWSVAWNYLHLPLVMGIAALSAGIQNLLAHQDIPVAPEARWLMTGAVAAALIVIGLIEHCAFRRPDEPTHEGISSLLKIGAGLVALVVGAVGGSLSAMTLTLVLIGLTLIQMLYGAYVWYSQPVAE